MFKLLRENRNVVLAALGIFVVTLSVFMLFLGHEPADSHDIKTSVVDTAHQDSQSTEDKYRSLIKNTEDPIIVIGINGTIEFASEDYNFMAGYKKDELLGKQYFTLIRAEDLPQFMIAFGKAVEAELPVNLVGPYQFLKADSSYLYEIASIYPLKTKGKISKMVLVIKDITRQMRTSENKLQKIAVDTQETAETSAGH